MTPTDTAPLLPSRCHPSPTLRQRRLPSPRRLVSELWCLERQRDLGRAVQRQHVPGLTAVRSPTSAAGIRRAASLAAFSCHLSAPPGRPGLSFHRRLSGEGGLVPVAKAQELQPKSRQSRAGCRQGEHPGIRASPSPRSRALRQARGSSFVPILSRDRSSQEPFRLPCVAWQGLCYSPQRRLPSRCSRGLGSKAVPGSPSFVKGFERRAGANIRHCRFSKEPSALSVRLAQPKGLFPPGQGPGGCPRPDTACLWEAR